jgi:hypothetical protein
MALLNSLIKPINTTYSYKLKAGDSLVIHRGTTNTYIILEGSLIMNRIFTNKEIFTTSLITTGNVVITFFDSLHATNYFYQVEAISTTYLISFNNLEHTITSKYINIVFNYYSIAEILIHKSVKHRLIHLLLILSHMFGKQQQEHISIDLTLSYGILSSITGSSRNTISRLIKVLENDNLIKYSKNKIIIKSLVNLSKYR